MSVQTDCRVTTWIRNSNRTSIKTQTRAQTAQRDTARRYKLKHPCSLEQTASSQTQQHTLRLIHKTDWIHPETDLPTAEMMPVCTVLEKRNSVVVGAELACSVQEENTAHRESYSADWQSVSLKTRPQDR